MTTNAHPAPLLASDGDLQPLTEDEAALLYHVQMFGSDGFEHSTDECEAW